VTCSFEDWQPRGTPVDAVVAVNSLHWIDLATQSGTHALGEVRRARFLARVRRRLESHGRPELTATVVGHLTVARRR
jgi:hypothetical protein